MFERLLLSLIPLFALINQSQPAESE